MESLVRTQGRCQQPDHIGASRVVATTGKVSIYNNIWVITTNKYGVAPARS